MATKVSVVYECKKCGTEVTVNSAGLKNMAPIYCCGLPLSQAKQAAVITAKKKITRTLLKKKSDKKELRRTSKKAAIRPSEK